MPPPFNDSPQAPTTSHSDKEVQCVTGKIKDTANKTRYKQRNTWYAVIAASNACLGYLFFLYYNTTFFNLLPFIEKELYPHDQRDLIIFVSGCPIITTAVGSLVGGPLAFTIGRKWVMIAADVLGIIGVILTHFYILSVLIIGRSIVGLSTGLSSVAASLYFIELAPVRYRGEFTNIPHIFSAIGVMLATLLGLLIPSHLGVEEVDYTTRTLITLAIIPAIIRTFCLLIYFRDETPGFYIGKYKYAKAEKILKKVAIKKVPSRVQELVKERNYVQRGSRQASFLTLFSKKFRRALFVGIVIYSLQYLSCIPFILENADKIWSVGYTTDTEGNIPNILRVTFVMINFFCTIIAVYITYRFGRRPLLIIGTFLTGAVMIIYAILALAISPGSLIPKIFLLFWPVGWSISLGSVAYGYVAESLPDNGVSLAIVCKSIVSYATIEVYFTMVDKVNRGWAYLLFGGIILGGTILLALFTVETKGKHKDEVLKLFNKDYQGISREEMQEEQMMNGRQFGPHVLHRYKSDITTHAHVGEELGA